MKNKVIVIGSGISGLSTAALLTKENIPVQIFKKFKSTKLERVIQ